MEKIQSAIAKARAERSAKSGGPSQAPSQAQVTHRPRTAEDASHQTWDALPLIEPAVRRLWSQRIVTLEGGREATPFDKLRTRMLQQMRAHGWRRVAITSPGMNSGKTTIALNLSFSLARQAGSRVVLSEMDLRKPSIQRTLRVKTERDFAKVINGEAPFDDHGIRIRSNIALGMLQRPMDNPAELLHNPNLAATLDVIEAQYDPSIMMFDMPPYQVSDDVMSFADKVDCVMIIAAAEYTKMSELDACERELANVTNVLGVVLNKCRYDTNDGSSDYYS